MISPSNLGQLWKSFSNKLLLQIVYFVYCITVSTLLLSVFDVRSTIGEIVGWSVLSGEVSWSNWPNGCIGQFGTFSVLVSSGFKSEFLFELDNRRLKCFFKFIFFFWKSEKNTGKNFPLKSESDNWRTNYWSNYWISSLGRKSEKVELKKIENRLSRSSDHKLPLSGCLSHSNVHHILLSYFFLFSEKVLRLVLILFLSERQIIDSGYDKYINDFFSFLLSQNTDSSISDNDVMNHIYESTFFPITNFFVCIFCKNYTFFYVFNFSSKILSWYSFVIFSVGRDIETLRNKFSEKHNFKWFTFKRFFF